MPDMRLSDGKIQDPNLAMTLRAELPGILNWAIRGLIRLQKYRTFPESRAGIQIKEDLQARSFPEIEFLQENFCASADSVMPIQDIYDRYRNWALENGERAVTQSKLWDSLLRTFPQCTKARNRIAGFQRVYVHGIKLLAEDIAARAQHVTEPAPAIPIAPAPVAHTAAPGLPAALNDPKWLERMTAQSA